MRCAQPAPSSRKSSLTLCLVSTCVLAALPFLSLLFGPRRLYWMDVLLQFHPWRVFLKASLSTNEWPLWNPYSYGGMPFAANLQSAMFYPPNWLLSFLPPDRALGWNVWLHFSLAGLFTTLWARSLGLRPLAAVFAGSVFMFSGLMFAHACYPTLLASSVWLPLVLLLTDRTIREKAWRGPQLLALVLAAQILSGHLQISAFTFGVALFRAVWVLIEQRTSGAAARRAILRIGTAFAAGGLLALPQLLPTVELSRLSTRWRADYHFASIYSLPPWHLVGLLLPNAFGSPASGNYWSVPNFWELCAYIGVAPLLLAAAALRRGIGRCVGFLGAATVLALVLAMGKYTPVFGLLHELPGMHAFKAPGRALVVFVLCLSVLSGVGLDAMLDPERRQQIGQRFASLAAATATVCAAFLAYLLMAREEVTSSLSSLLRAQCASTGRSLDGATFPNLAAECYNQLLVSIVVAISLLTALLLTSRLNGLRRLGSPTTALILGLLTIGDLLSFGLPIVPTAEASVYRHVPSLTRAAPTGPQSPRILSRPGLILHAWGTYLSWLRYGPSDPATIAGLLDTQTPNLNMVWHLPNAEGYDPLKPDRYGKFLFLTHDILTARRDDLKLLNLLNVGRVAVVGESLPCPPWVKHDLGAVEVYENPRRWPRAWVVPGLHMVHGWEEIREELLHTDWDPTREALIEESVAVPARSTTAWQPATIVSYHNNAVLCVLPESASGFLVLSDAYFPGWRASVDGRAVPLLRANGAFRAVPVQKGSRQCRFLYFPMAFVFGCFLALLTMMALASSATWRGLDAGCQLRYDSSTEENTNAGGGDAWTRTSSNGSTIGP